MDGRLHGNPEKVLQIDIRELLIQYVIASKRSGIGLFMRNTKQNHHLSYISFKLVPLCNYTLLSETVNELETFLEVIF
jgi:hypothetical protein